MFKKKNSETNKVYIFKLLIYYVWNLTLYWKSQKHQCYGMPTIYREGLNMMPQLEHFIDFFEWSYTM